MSRRIPDKLLRDLREFPASFPEVHAAGAMRPHSQTIHLYQGRKSDIKSCNQSRMHMERARPAIETILHEVTHWYDLIGSVWGQNYLNKLFTSIDIVLTRKNAAEFEFYNIIDLYDEDRRILFPLYYHMVLDEPQTHSTKKPWRINFSSGLEFNPYGLPDHNLPLFFVNFSDHDSDQLISRQPLSIGSLLETRAVASELNACHECTAFISKDPSEFRVKLQINYQEKVGILYNKHLTTYTAPAHLLSFFCDIRDPLETYAYGAALANIALNLTAEHFQMLKSPESFFGFGEDRVTAFCHRQSRGYAFAAIAKQAPKYSPETGVDEWLDTALYNSNLPGKKTIFEEARATIDNLKFSLQESRLNEISSYYQGLAKTYLTLMKGRCEQELFLSDLFQQKLRSPSLIDEDGEVFAISKALDEKRYVPEELLDNEYALGDFCDNFLQGCRGVRNG